MDYREALQFLDSLANFEKDRSFSYPEALNLDRMRRLAKAFGNPQNAYISAIVAGSKGKGSTAAILASILRMENLKVGLYTSPHLFDVRERIQVNGLPISEIRFAEHMRETEKLLDEYEWRKDPPTYFEVLTAVAFAHFKEMKVQAAVLEVGLGGLYDSTNIVEAKAVGIAPIGLEHTDKLGKTISKIAVQKCGVIKGREWVVSAPQVREAETVVTEACNAREAKLFWVGRDLKIVDRSHDEDSQVFDFKAPFAQYFGLKLPLLGEHQLENAAMAIGLAWGVGEKLRVKISDAAVKQGVLDVSWPGRLEKISDRPRTLVDGAHTKDSMRRLLEGLSRHFHYSRLVIVLGLAEDKDVTAILDELLPASDAVIATESGHTRALPAAKIAEAAEGLDKPVRVEKDFETALAAARAEAGEDGLVVVTGSLYLVARARAGRDS